MPWSKTILLSLLGTVAYSRAYSIPRLSDRQNLISDRSTYTSASIPAPSISSAVAPSGAPPVPAAAAAITDVDILQFALTLEHLESSFYAQGFELFPDSDFLSLGLKRGQIDALKQIGATEQTHVSTLLSALAQSGQRPVEACEYDFQFSDAKSMLSTARVLEAVGVSAYLGAAPLVQSSGVLSVAASIVTVEARHQTFLRSASAAPPVPAAFDTALGIKSVFTLAATFIKSCPQGSVLPLQANSQIALKAPTVTSGQLLVLQDSAQPAGAVFCAFINQGITQYAPLMAGQCQVPANLAGEVYMLVTKSKSIADADVLAGPSVIQM